jgi:hypothetical protein
VPESWAPSPSDDPVGITTTSFLYLWVFLHTDSSLSPIKRDSVLQFVIEGIYIQSSRMNERSADMIVKITCKYIFLTCKVVWENLHVLLQIIEKYSLSMPRIFVAPVLECILKTITWNVNRSNVTSFYRHFQDNYLINALLSLCFPHCVLITKIRYVPVF